jgi:hypothetical protein
MNFTILSFLLALVFWVQPCDRKGVELNQEFDLKVGQVATVEGTGLKIGLTSVREDSRCPEDVTCIWAGNAKVAFSLQKGKSKSAPVELNTGIDPRRHSYMGYEVRLVGLRPNPKSKTTLDKKRYVATLIVSKQ